MLIGAVSMQSHCASRKPAASSFSSRSVLQLGEQRQASDTLAVAEAMAQLSDSTTYLVLDEDGRIVEELTMRREPTDVQGATLAIHEAERRAQFVRADENGDMVLVAVLDQKERALSRFDPPLVLAPAKLEPGETRRSEAAMRVVDRDRPSRQREAGRAVREVRYAGDQEIQTPRGRFLAKRMETRFEADLRMASVDERTVTFIVPELGIVAEQSRETVRVLGAFGSTDRRTLLRADLAQPER